MKRSYRSRTRNLLLGALAVATVHVVPCTAAADADADFVTVESATAGRNAVAVVSDPAGIAALYGEMRSLEPSASGLPRFVVYFWKDREVARAFGAFESDLADHPSLAALVRELRAAPRSYMYRVVLPDRYLGRNDEVVAGLEERGLRALFHRGAGSGQPYFEILLTERVDALPDVAATRDDPDRAEFARALGGLFANRSDDPRVASALSRLEATLYAFHQGLVTNEKIRSLHESFRRYYRLGEERGPKVSLVARYTVSSPEELGEVARFFADKGVRGPERSGPYAIEVLSDDPDPERVRERIAAVFPDVEKVGAYPER